MRNTARVNIKSRDCVRRVVAVREGALPAACARGRNVEWSDSALLVAQEAVRRAARVNVRSRGIPAGLMGASVRELRATSLEPGAVGPRLLSPGGQQRSSAADFPLWIEVTYLFLRQFCLPTVPEPPARSDFSAHP